MFPIAPAPKPKTRPRPSGPIRSSGSRGAPKAKAKPLLLPPGPSSGLGRGGAAPPGPAPGAPGPSGRPPLPPPSVPPPVEPTEDDDDDAIMVPPPRPTPETREVRDNWQAGVGDVLVRFEPYTTPAGIVADNWTLKCPLHDGCEKSKGTATKDMRQFGAIGALAFVHAWIPLAVPAGRTHASQNPRKADVAAYLAAHRTELEDIVERQGL